MSRPRRLCLRLAHGCGAGEECDAEEKNRPVASVANAWNVVRVEEKSQGEPVARLGFSFILSAPHGWRCSTAAAVLLI
jgi:hypothetical protein